MLQFNESLGFIKVEPNWGLNNYSVPSIVWLECKLSVFEFSSILSNLNYFLSLFSFFLSFLSANYVGSNNLKFEYY